MALLTPDGGGAEGRAARRCERNYQITVFLLQQSETCKSQAELRVQCDWGRTHIAVERKHTEWRDHHTNQMWHQRGTLTYPRFRTRCTNLNPRLQQLGRLLVERPEIGSSARNSGNFSSRLEAGAAKSHA